MCGKIEEWYRPRHQHRKVHPTVKIGCGRRVRIAALTCWVWIVFEYALSQTSSNEHLSPSGRLICSVKNTRGNGQDLAPPITFLEPTIYLWSSTEF